MCKDIIICYDHKLFRKQEKKQSQTVFELIQIKYIPIIYYSLVTYYLASISQKGMLFMILSLLKDKNCFFLSLKNFQM